MPLPIGTRRTEAQRTMVILEDGPYWGEQRSGSEAAMYYPAKPQLEAAAGYCAPDSQVLTKYPEAIAQHTVILEDVIRTSSAVGCKELRF